MQQQSENVVVGLLFPDGAEEEGSVGSPELAGTAGDRKGMVCPTEGAERHTSLDGDASSTDKLEGPVTFVAGFLLCSVDHLYHHAISCNAADPPRPGCVEQWIGTLPQSEIAKAEARLTEIDSL